MEKLIYERKKVPGISYAFTKDGIELPVLDVTHPLFISSINEENLDRKIKEIAPKARRNAESFNKIPGFIKRYFAKRSYIMASLVELTSGNPYVSGLSTMMMKLGPGLIGRGRERWFDRIASRPVGACMIRMRARDTAQYLADSISGDLKKYPDKELMLVNIGGGTGNDSLNALILLHKTDPDLLSGRKTEIFILDIDDYGPWFACKSAEALTSTDGILYGIDLSCSYIRYDWKEVAPLTELLGEHPGCIAACSSEGGLFEYGDERNLLENLQTLSAYPGNPMKITGSFLRDPETIDPIMMETLSMTKIQPVLYGIERMNKISDKTGWKITAASANNPRYIVFTLAKKDIQ
jgi:hypothetical protein